MLVKQFNDKSNKWLADFLHTLYWPYVTDLYLHNITLYWRNMYVPICSNIILHVQCKYPANMHISTELNILFGYYTCVSYKKSYYLYIIFYASDIHNIRKPFFEN